MTVKKATTKKKNPDRNSKKKQTVKKNTNSLPSDAGNSKKKNSSAAQNTGDINGNDAAAKMQPGEEAGRQIKKLQGYYKFHSLIYDATRWSFLFGREEIIRRLPDLPSGASVLEVGCGTGKNLLLLAEKYPDALLTGYDVSADMIRLAEKKLQSFKDRVTLHTEPYGPHIGTKNRYDLILFSYALSMINPQYAEVISQASEDLKPGGFAAVVDFYDGISAYKKYMQLNHVRMDAHLLPVLNDFFESEYISIRKAYGGIWKYMLFIGKKLK